MWHCNRCYSAILFAFALGLLLGNTLESWFLRTLLITGALVLGLLSCGKRR